MSEYLVHIEISGVPAADHKRLYDMEREHCKGPEVTALLRRLWREACTTNNWGLWEAEDVSVLHETIASLPLFPFMKVPLIVPLARNINDPGPEQAFKRAGYEVYRLPGATSQTPFIPSDLHRP
jgi:muconolactone D-isomerase